MAANFESLGDQLLVADDDDIISSASEDDVNHEQGQGRLELRPEAPQGSREVTTQGSQREYWPKRIGVVHLVWGIVVLICGLAQLLVIPLIEDRETSYWKPHLDKTNFYGVVLWSAILLLLSGSLGLRSAIYHTLNDLYIFVSVVMFELAALFSFLILIIVSYSSHWVSRDAFPEGSLLYPVTLVGAVTTATAFALVVLAFVQYYEMVFCGELQLCRKCVHICVPCWCPRAINQDQLYNDDQSRPPSLPV